MRYIRTSHNEIAIKTDVNCSCIKNDCIYLKDFEVSDHDIKDHNLALCVIS